MASLNTDRGARLWLPQHQAAFKKTCKTLCSPPYLTYFDPTRETELLANASRIHGLGFLLCQRCRNTWKTIQCGSRTLAKLT